MPDNFAAGHHKNVQNSACEETFCTSTKSSFSHTRKISKLNFSSKKRSVVLKRKLTDYTDCTDFEGNSTDSVV